MTNENPGQINDRGGAPEAGSPAVGARCRNEYLDDMFAKESSTHGPATMGAHPRGAHKDNAARMSNPENKVAAHNEGKQTANESTGGRHTVKGEKANSTERSGNNQTGKPAEKPTEKQGFKFLKGGLRLGLGVAKNLMNPDQAPADRVKPADGKNPASGNKTEPENTQSAQKQTRENNRPSQPREKRYTSTWDPRLEPYAKGKDQTMRQGEKPSSLGNPEGKVLGEDSLVVQTLQRAFNAPIEEVRIGPNGLLDIELKNPISVPADPGDPDKLSIRTRDTIRCRVSLSGAENGGIDKIIIEPQEPKVPIGIQVTEPIIQSHQMVEKFGLPIPDLDVLPFLEVNRLEITPGVGNSCMVKAEVMNFEQKPLPLEGVNFGLLRVAANIAFANPKRTTTERKVVSRSNPAPLASRQTRLD